MKIILAVLFSGILLSGSYKKDDIYWGYVNAQRNGTNWSAKIKARYSTIFTGKFDLIFERFNENDILIESLGFETIPPSAGRYRVFKRDFTSPRTRKERLLLFTL